MRCLRLLPLVALVLGLLALPAWAAVPERGEILHAAPPGPIVDAPDGRSDMELVRFDGRVVAALQALAPEETLRVDDWPVSPGRRAEVVLRRFDVYAPDAKIVVIENGVEREAPRAAPRQTGSLEADTVAAQWPERKTATTGVKPARTAA